MSKVFSRLLIFFIGLPLCCVIALWPVLNHLPMHLVIIASSVLGAMELYSIFKVHTPLLPKPLVVICTGLLPAVACICRVVPAVSNSLPLGGDIVTYLFIAVFIVFLAAEVFTAKEFKNSNSKLAASSFILVYCGILPTFVSKMTIANVGGLDASGPLIIIFLLMVFLCDSLAWFFGVLLGKNNRGFVKASPNKSIAGFAGGFLGSVLAGVLGYFIWKPIFVASSCSIVKMVITGVLIALTGIVGDLTESIFKRSSGVKDSGNIVIGRGGVLDSIDSILLAAPVYYLCMTIFLGNVFA